MDRLAMRQMESWATQSDRRPIVLRGARQVGKSFLVQQLAKRRGMDLVTVDCEVDPNLAGLFEAGSPDRVLTNLEAYAGRPLRPGSSLLFIDEIQAAPRAFPFLRYFYERKPELHVAAAGSLLELYLGESAISVPVGRVEYLHLGPMTFDEFLRAGDKATLADWLAGYPLGEPVPEALHQQLVELLQRYLVLGGMPAVVATYVRTGSVAEASARMLDLIRSLEDDFGKYRRKIDAAHLRTVFRALPRWIGERIKYTRLAPDLRGPQIAAVLDLLCRARLASRVVHTAANGPPLGSEADPRRFKTLMLDVGLAGAAVGLNLTHLVQTHEMATGAVGALAEQMVGQHLLATLPPAAEPELHFWARDARGSEAEVDYVIASGPDVVPVEVKAGKTGSLRSLHAFLREKRTERGVRLNAAPPSLLDASPGLPDGSRLDFRLLSLPLYMAGQLRRLVGEWLTRPAG